MRRTILAALAILMAGTGASFAVEKLKVAIPQRGFWDSTWVEFGEAAGFFKDAGLEIEVFYTEGGAQTVATVVSGSVDIAMSNGILGAIGAYVKWLHAGTWQPKLLLQLRKAGFDYDLNKLAAA